MKRWIFYVLSFTWGLPLTLVGAVLVAAVLIIMAQAEVQTMTEKVAVVF